MSGFAVTGDKQLDDDKPGSTGLSSSSDPQAQGPATAAPRPRSRPRRAERLQGLPAWRRLRQTREFARVERQGARASAEHVAVTVRQGPGRLGFVVSKKVDTRASERNLVKRRLREILRREKDRFLRRPGGSVDVIVTARDSAKGLDFAVLRDDVLSALARALERLATSPPPRRR